MKKNELSLEVFKKLEYLNILRTILDLKNPLISDEENPNDLISHSNSMFH